MVRNYEEVLKGRYFDFIFVDDVDVFFKVSKNIDCFFYFFGFMDEII